MAVSRLIRKIRCEDVLQKFANSDKGCVFFTLTTPDIVDYREIRNRWRNLRHWLSRRLGKNAKYVMNYEVHPRGHGWHIHSVWNCYINLHRHLTKIQSFGFGRVDIRRVDSVGVADYLTKHALKAYSGVSRNLRSKGLASRLRLVNASRGLPVLSDYEFHSELKEQTKTLFNLSKDGGVFRTIFAPERWRICELGALLGIKDGLNLIKLYRAYKSLIDTDAYEFIQDFAMQTLPTYSQEMLPFGDTPL